VLAPETGVGDSTAFSLPRRSRFRPLGEVDPDSMVPTASQLKTLIPMGDEGAKCVIGIDLRRSETR
jgi:hypothetical protein